MEENGNAPSQSYYNSQQPTSAFPTTYVAYPSTSSYPYQAPQTQYTSAFSAYGNAYGSQSNSQSNSQGNSYSQAVTDYAANRYFSPYQQSPISNKTQTNLKWNTKPRKSPYSKSSYSKSPASGPAVSRDLHCAICKVNCVGEQSYKTHCEGQKHKKKELLMNGGQSTPKTPKTKASNSSYFCEVCEVPCTGPDSYNAHLNGKSHIKVCNLQAKLGKEIPPELVAPILKSTGQSQVSNETGSRPSTNIKVIGTPAINFVKGECLNTMADFEVNASESADKKEQADGQQANGQGAINDQQTDGQETNGQANETNGQANETNGSIEPSDNSVTEISAPGDESAANNSIPFIDDQDSAANQENAASQSEPVGVEYITEYNQPNSKATYYSCTLCNCKFSEITAKEQHVRGKRHHKAYNSKHNKKAGRSKPMVAKGGINQFNPANDQAPSYNQQASYNQTPSYNPPAYNQPASYNQAPSYNQPASYNQAQSYNQSASYNQATPMRRPPSFSNLLPGAKRPNKKQRTTTNDHPANGAPDTDEQPNAEFTENMDIRSFIECDFYETPHTTQDNRYLLRKHAEIVPREDDLKLFYRHIGNVEKSLKLVSDEFLRDKDGLKEALSLPVVDDGRLLQGEIRAGLFGKKLLLRDERQIDLILFCSVKPNVPLLRKVAEVLAAKLALIPDEKYQVQENIEMAAIDVRASNSTIRITLTSLYFRDMNVPTQQQNEERFKDPEQMLNRQRCLDALTALRRFKWYLAKVGPFQPCPMLIRLLKELTKRVPAWKPLTCWALELICERVLSNCTTQPSPADGFKFILRTLAAGALLSDSYEAMLIQDPCEFEKVDALAYLSDQQRKAITESAQDFVGLIAFNKIHQVLGVERIEFGQKKAGEAASNGEAVTGDEEQKSSLDIGIDEKTTEETAETTEQKTEQTTEQTTGESNGTNKDPAAGEDQMTSNDVDR